MKHRRSMFGNGSAKVLRPRRRMLIPPGKTLKTERDYDRKREKNVRPWVTEE